MTATVGASLSHGLVLGSSSPDLPPLYDLCALRSLSAPRRSPCTVTRRAQLASEPSGCLSGSSSSVVQISGRCKVGKTCRPEHHNGVISGQAASLREYQIPDGSRSTESQGWRQFKSPTPERAPAPVPGIEVRPRSSKARPHWTGAVSRHFSAATDQPSTPPEADADTPLNLEYVGSRKKDWTPPPAFLPASPTTAADPDAMEMSTQQVAACENDLYVPPPRKVFGTLRERFGCADGHEAGRVTMVGEGSESLLQPPAEIFKRKTIDLAPSHGGRAEKSPSKVKSRKKKVRTITEIATEAYRPGQLPEVEETVSGTGAISLPSLAARARARGLATSKPKKGRAKVSKTTQSEQAVLLLPEDALRQAARQSFVFGTSSQLALHPSSPFSQMHDLSAASRSSIVVHVPSSRTGLVLGSIAEDDPFGTPINSDAIEVNDSHVSLWEAGARNVDGELVDLDVAVLAKKQVDLGAGDADPFGYLGGMGPSQVPAFASTVTPQPSEQQLIVSLDDSTRDPFTASGDSLYFSAGSTSVLAPGVVDLASSPASRASFGSFDIQDDFAPASMPPSPASLHPQPQPSDRAPPSAQPNGRESLSSSPIECLTHDQPGVHGQSAEALPLPDFEQLSDAQLERKFARLSNGPAKKRTAMVALLYDRWQESSRPNPWPSASSLPRKGIEPPSTVVEAAADPKPRRGRGRPRKVDNDSSTDPRQPETEIRPPKSPKEVRDRLLGQKSVVPASRGTTTTKSTTGKKQKKKTKPSSLSRSRSPSGSGTKKVAATRQDDVIEIPDSASDASTGPRRHAASPCRRGLAPTSDLNQAVTSLDSDSDEELDADPALDPDAERSLLLWTEDQVKERRKVPASSAGPQAADSEATLFLRITHAVRNAPRGCDAAHPSLAERILLYEPVDVEELTQWLNGGGLLAPAGLDRGVTPVEVMRWAESRGVVCIWRTTGRARHR